MQREVSRKLYAQLPELSQLLDRTLARAPKDEYGPPPASLWHRLVVSRPTLKSPLLSSVHWVGQPQQTRVAAPSVLCAPLQ